MGGVFSLTGCILCALVFLCIMIVGGADAAWKDAHKEQIATWWMVLWMSIWCLLGAGTVFLGALTAYLWGAIGH